MTAPIMIMAGGTGGHVFPGLAVAEEIRSRSGSVVWMGTRKGLEARLVPDAGIEVEWISVSGLRGRGVFAWLAAPFRLALALLQAFVAMRRRQPAVVLGLGGFVSGPGGIAAWLSGRPLLIHEQNAVAGTTNRILARFARRVFQAFPNSFPSGVRAELIGNPVRREILNLPESSKLAEASAGAPLRVLILGGSQGAAVLNQRVPAALAALPERLRLEIWHQAGRGLEDARDAYAKCGVEARLDAFVDDMANAYGWADLVVCRAGALTIAELAAAGLGAILVPYPYAIDDHQTRNADSFASRGAGVVIPEDEFTSERLARELTRLLEDRSFLAQFRESARAQALPDATKDLADICFELAEVRS